MSGRPNRSEFAAVHGALRALIGLWILLAIGCRSLEWDVNTARRIADVAAWGGRYSVQVRKRPDNPLEETLNLLGRGGPSPSERTNQFLRRSDLQELYDSDPQKAFTELRLLVESEPTLEKVYALAELSYVEGERTKARTRDEHALPWFAGAIVYSHKFLFDSQLNAYRNAYDPVFRRVCDIYNQSLEGMLRILNEEGMIQPGRQISLPVFGSDLQFAVSIEGRWRDRQIQRLEFVSDYQISGLTNVYHTYGLGVPLIVVPRQPDVPAPDEKFYPPGLTLPMTAFFQLLPAASGGSATMVGALQLFDPLEKTSVPVDDRLAPLESDISTPLAYYLDDPLLDTKVFATFAMIDEDFGQQFRGLYMLEPFDPNKIPVVMVHGLWSSPVTFTQMFNDLRAMGEIRQNFQFWFYLYPTGQPFWVSAQQMRQDLLSARQTLDPGLRSVSLDNMVLVGHSMGGLIARLQTLDSGSEFWQMISKQPFSQLKGEPDVVDQLQRTLFFAPNPSVRRVITMATPHKGSNFANSVTTWVSHTFFRLPSLLQQSSQIVRENEELLDDVRLLNINNSVASLAPESPFFAAMNRARSAPWVHYHNIVGHLQSKDWFSALARRLNGEGDGIVGLDSAAFQQAESQIIVPTDHGGVHQHPRTILEVRRILLDHLREFQFANGRLPSAVPVDFDQPLVGTVPYGQAGQPWRPTSLPHPGDDPRVPLRQALHLEPNGEAPYGQR